MPIRRDERRKCDTCGAELRRCQAPACMAWFAPRQGKQRFHSEACRQAAFRNRAAKVKPQRKRKG